MTIGLVLGKFAPLHRGHQLLIDIACQENDHVIVLAYQAPETTSVPLTIRAGWIRRLYPDIEVIEASDGPTVIGDSPEIQALHDAYLARRLAGRDITAFYSSEPYGAHVSRGLGARDRRVDPQRIRVPTSATAIRADPWHARQFLDPVVYRDLIVRVVFLGAPSTGKTTLARAAAERLKTIWMPEYGREFWERHQQQRRLTPEELVEIAEEHRRREDQMLLDANRVLMIDTNATTTRQFALDYHGHALPRLTELADACSNRYDLFFLCGTDIPYDDTWDRSGAQHREDFQKRTEADLIDRGTPLVRLFGDLDARLQEVVQTLQGFDRFAPGPIAQGQSVIRWSPQ